MGRNFISWVELGVAAGLALQPAHAGDRKAAVARHAESSTHSLIFAAQARSSGDNRAGTSMKVQGRGDLPFVAVSPFESRLPRAGAKASTSDDKQKEKGPTTPRERKSITFFRLDPKFGDISVQPVVGGVNGAQLSVGF
jgi:hypothetical protein